MYFLLFNQFIEITFILFGAEKKTKNTKIKLL